MALLPVSRNPNRPERPLPAEERKRRKPDGEPETQVGERLSVALHPPFVPAYDEKEKAPDAIEGPVADPEGSVLQELPLEPPGRPGGVVHLKRECLRMPVPRPRSEEHTSE